MRGPESGEGGTVVYVDWAWNGDEAPRLPCRSAHPSRGTTGHPGNHADPLAARAVSVTEPATSALAH